MNINWISIVALIVSIYGAVLSSIMKFNEYQLNKRKIKVFLVFVAYMERFKLSIVNISKRPITLVSISFSIGEPSGDDSQIGSKVPTAFLFEEESDSFPITLSDGEKVDLFIAEPIQEIMEEFNNMVNIKIYDAEGREFSEFKYMEQNIRYGHFVGKNK